MYNANIVTSDYQITWSTYAYLEDCNFSIPPGIRSASTILACGSQFSGMAIQLQLILWSPYILEFQKIIHNISI